VNIQIYGSKKCFDTKKAERYFKERKIKYQYIDLLRYGMSQGELNSVKAAVGLKELINSKAQEYDSLNLARITSSEVKERLLLENLALFKTPIVRNGRQATVGYRPEIWKDWE